MPSCRPTRPAAQRGTPPVQRLAVAAQREGVLPLPRRAARRAQLARAVVARLEATPLAARGGETTQLAVLVHRAADPVDARVPTHGLVHGIDHDALIVLVHGVLRDPVRVEHSQPTTGAADALLSLALQIAPPLVLIDAAVPRLAEVNALGRLLLAAAAA